MLLTRQLNQNLNRTLRRCCLTRRLDGRPFHPPDYFAIACGHLEKYVRLLEKAAREEPHRFGPNADRYYRDTIEMERDQKLWDAALKKAYGPKPADTPSRPSVWQDRYQIRTRHMPTFRKWFKENYGQ